MSSAIESKTMSIELELDESETILFRNAVDHLTDVNMLANEYCGRWATLVEKEGNRLLLWAEVDKEVGRSQVNDEAAQFAFETGHILPRNYRSLSNDEAARFAFENGYILPRNYYCLDAAIAHKALVLGVKWRGFQFIHDAEASEIGESIQKALFGKVMFRV